MCQICKGYVFCNKPFTCSRSFKFLNPNLGFVVSHALMLGNTACLDIQLYIIGCKLVWEAKTDVEIPLTMFWSSLQLLGDSNTDQKLWTFVMRVMTVRSPKSNVTQGWFSKWNLTIFCVWFFITNFSAFGHFAWLKWKAIKIWNLRPSFLQLLRIEEELGDQAVYAGQDWRVSSWSVLSLRYFFIFFPISIFNVWC